MELVSRGELPVTEITQPSREHRDLVHDEKRKIAGLMAEDRDAVFEQIQWADSEFDAAKIDHLPTTKAVAKVEALTEYLVTYTPDSDSINNAFRYFHMVPQSYNTDIFLSIFGVTIARLGAPDEAEKLVVREMIVEPNNQHAVMAAVAVAEARRGNIDRANLIVSVLYTLAPDELQQLKEFIDRQPQPA